MQMRDPTMVVLVRRAKWSVTAIVVGLIALWALSTSFSDFTFRRIGRLGERPHVQLRQGKISGIEVKSDYPQVLEQFLGVPFALSTAGEGRFRPPVPIPASETAHFDASKYGKRCPSGANGSPQGEDCLNLNIFRPKIRGEKKRTKLPVLVYIHGGAFNAGFGNFRQIQTLVAWATEPFIGISFNYRVGALGFLPSDLTAQEGLLNIGLRDQIMLLQWVRDNIAEFGGDVDNVTIMGSSAGAHSVGHHLFLNPDEPPLFSRVIIESGAATARAVYSYNHPLHEQQFSEFIERLGAQDIPQDKLMGYIRQQSVDYVRSASDSLYYKYNPSVRWPFQPVIDGENGMVAMRPIDAWRTGRFHKVPILTGYNTHEGAMFVPWRASTNEQFKSFFTTLLPQLSSSDIDALCDLYSDPVTDPTSPYLETRTGMGAQYARLTAAYGQFAYIAPVRQTVHWASQPNGSESVYLYHFGASSSVKGGADHGTHFGWVDYTSAIRETSSTVKEISGLMHAYWTSFILTGDPNAVPGRYPDRMQWDPYDSTEGQGRLLMFGEGNNEVADGKQKGVVVQVKDDGFAARESKYWWDRTDMFEI